MAFYIKVTKEVADRLHLTATGQRMAMYYCGRRTWHVSPATRYLTGPRKRAASA